MCRTPERSNALEAVELRHQPVLGRRLAEDRRAELADQAEPLGRVERALVEDGRRALAPRAEQHVPDRLRPAGAGRAPDEVVRLRVEPALGLRALRPRVPVGVHDALRILRRPGRVEDEARDPRRRCPRSRDRARPARPRRCRRPPATRPSPRSRRASRGRRRGGPRRSGGPGSRGPSRAASPSTGSRPRPPSARRASTENQSGVLPISTSTRSPGATPRSRRRPAQRAAASATSPKVRSRTAPSRSQKRSASLAGSCASTTSRAKLNRAGVTAAAPPSSSCSSRSASRPPTPRRGRPSAARRGARRARARSRARRPPARAG